jgi:hypothetical protein
MIHAGLETICNAAGGGKIQPPAMIKFLQHFLVVRLPGMHQLHLDDSGDYKMLPIPMATGLKAGKVKTSPGLLNLATHENIRVIEQRLFQ